MRVTAVTMVKDEVDVIEYTLRHMAAQKVDLIVVADNMSTDGTYELLTELARELPIKLERDEKVGYYQSEKMTRLANVAAHGESAWVIPFDADELWHTATGEPIADYLQRFRQEAAAAKLYNHFPTSQDEPNDNPFLQITHCDRNAAPLPKVAVRWCDEAVIEMGNHGVQNREVHRSRLIVRHFPWRSFDQFLKKVRNGAAAYKATDLPQDFGAHWRGYGHVLETGGEQALHDEVWARWYFDPPADVDLILDPAPYMEV